MTHDDPPSPELRNACRSIDRDTPGGPAIIDFPEIRRQACPTRPSGRRGTGGTSDPPLFGTGGTESGEVAPLLPPPEGDARPALLPRRGRRRPARSPRCCRMG